MSRTKKKSPDVLTATSKADSNGAREITIHGAPVPAARPRVGRWGTYYPKTYKLWMESADRALAELEAEPLTGPVSVFADIVCEPFKTVVREFPKGDIDNLLKGILDAITKAKIAWVDDKQIVEIYAVKRFPAEGEVPHARITIKGSQ